MLLLPHHLICQSCIRGWCCLTQQFTFLVHVWIVFGVIPLREACVDSSRKSLQYRHSWIIKSGLKLSLLTSLFTLSIMHQSSFLKLFSYYSYGNYVLQSHWKHLRFNIESFLLVLRGIFSLLRVYLVHTFVTFLMLTKKKTRLEETTAGDSVLTPFKWG